MIRGVFALLALSVIVSSGALAQNSNVNVRVRLLHLVFPISIEGTSLQVTDLDRQEIENVSIPRGDSLVIDHKKIGREKFWILKKGDKIVRSSRAFIEIQSASPKIKISGFELPSPLVLSPHGTTVDVIGALKMDDYLEGVLAGEMPAAWPLEALKAQAIAARTYTLFEMQERAKDIYQLDGVLDQAYTPLLKGSQKEKIREALDQTQDKVLYKNGRLFKAFYHSDCGGQTEDPSVVWGSSKGGDIAANSHVSAPAIIDSQCAFSPTGKWTLDVSLDELKDKLNSSGLSLADVKNVRVASRTPSQRADLLAFNDGQEDTLVSGNNLRRILGYKKLKSTLFTIVQKGNEVIFDGRGNGHGSGLCQWGARYMAEKGSRVVAILNHYYPSATLSEFHVAHR